jgi:hypothetical protein
LFLLMFFAKRIKALDTSTYTATAPLERLNSVFTAPIPQKGHLIRLARA